MFFFFTFWLHWDTHMESSQGSPNSNPAMCTKAEKVSTLCACNSCSLEFWNWIFLFQSGQVPCSLCGCWITLPVLVLNVLSSSSIAYMWRFQLLLLDECHTAFLGDSIGSHDQRFGICKNLQAGYHPCDFFGKQASINITIKTLLE